MLFSFAPMLVFLLVGGVVVDRLPRLRVMFAADLLNGAVVGLIAYLAEEDRTSFVLIALAPTV